MPHVLYHPAGYLEDMYGSHQTRYQREPVSITLAVLLGIGVTAGIGTGTSALVQGPQQYSELKNAMMADLKELEKSITRLEESLASLAEVALQNQRGLDLLFLKEGGLCVALREECWFYVNHSGVIRDSMTKLRERLVKRQWEAKAQQGWFKGWFNRTPWLTTLISTLVGPLFIVLLLLTFGPCLLTRLL
ncbi:Envelope glycoprotein [Cricetulus griseus]|uniref:Envelope glycoprotein n=1 Tax=Cricetulus griseus TaxID=10029 RepID=G3H0N3_CRIGR|nr:Envelope glycoprotein [Cricetulus griseus]